MNQLNSGELKRMMLYKVAKGNPQIIVHALDEIRSMAKEALQATLNDAEPKVINALNKKVDAVYDMYIAQVRRMLDKVCDEFAKKLDSTVDEKLKTEVGKIKLPKGDKGDRPSEKEIRDLISLLMPAPIPGRPPTKDEIMACSRIVVKEMIANMMNKTPGQVAEEQKALKDLIYGVAMDVIGTKISEVKRFGGGGASNGSSAVNVNTLDGTIDGSNTTFIYKGLATLKFIVADGISYFSGNGYSKSGNTITMDIPPSQFIKAIT
jgi:hypothetical protein